MVLHKTSSILGLRVIKNNLSVLKRTLPTKTALKPEECPFEKDPKPRVTSANEHDFANALPYDQIPGPKHLPFIGALPHFLPGGKFCNKTLIELHTLLKRDYGDLVKLPGMFGKPDFIFAFDPDDIAMLFRTEGPWPSRFPLEVFEHYRVHERFDIYQGVSGLVSDQGEKWYKTRTLVNPVMLKPKTVKLYVDVIDKIADEFVARIRQIRNSNNEMPADFGNEMNKWALESIAYIGLDQRLGLLSNIDKDSDGQRLIKAVHDFFDLSYQLEVMPSPWKYIKTPGFKKLMKVLNTMTDMASKFVQEGERRLKAKTEDSSSSAEELSVLEKLLQIDRRIAIIMVMDMLLAGVDTTSNSSITNFYLLAKNQDKQNLLREEVLQKLPNEDSSLTTQSMANMPYLRACIKESARMHPITLGTVRGAGQDIVLKGFKIPKGTYVCTSQAMLSNNEKYFEQSSKYLPERFLKANEDESIKSKHPFTYLPFGFGPRMCIGRRFAELEMEILLAKIIRNFRIEWHHPDIKYVSKMINVPSGELKFRFIDLD